MRWLKISSPLRCTRLARGFVVLSGVMLTALSALPVLAQRIDNDVAVFAALDKVTARIKELEVPLNETVEFGALKVTPRVCYTRPPTERPKTTTFVQIDETELDGSEKRIFSGWMFAESPGLNAVEHPVFDVWLTGCAKPRGGAPQAASVNPVQDEDGAQAEDASPSANDQPRRRRRRVRR